MEPEDVPIVAAIDRVSFPSPWRESAYMHELRRNSRSAYYVLLEPAALRERRNEAAMGRRPWWARCFNRVLSRREKPGVIGYVGFRLESAYEMHISTIAVHPDWRGRGLGELLLLTAIEKTLERGVRMMSLEVRPSNKTAQRLYQKYGFQFKSVQYGYYRDGENALLMEANLSGAAYQARIHTLRQNLMAALGGEVLTVSTG